MTSRPGVTSARPTSTGGLVQIDTYALVELSDLFQGHEKIVENETFLIVR